MFIILRPSKEFFSNKRLSDANCDSRNEFAKIMRDIESVNYIYLLIIFFLNRKGGWFSNKFR